MAARRVAVTGAGVVSPLGATLQEFHRSLAAGRSGVQVGATLDWNPATLFKEAEAANLDRVTQSWRSPPARRRSAKAVYK